MLGDGICHPLCFTLFWHIIKVKLSFDESPDEADPQVTEDSNKPVCVCSSCHNWIQKQKDYPFLYVHFLPQNEKSHRKFQQWNSGLVIKETLIVLETVHLIRLQFILLFSVRQIGELYFQLIFPGVSPLSFLTQKSPVFQSSYKFLIYNLFHPISHTHYKIIIII